MKSQEQLTEEGALKLRELLAQYYDIFSLTEDERGVIDLVKFKIDTEDACPKRQAVRRVPFAAQKEISHQQAKMQHMGVIRPSESPWADPVVQVRKRDEILRFCVDY